MILPPGTYQIGVEPRIRANDQFLRPHHQTPEPALSTTIFTLPDQAYVLEISFLKPYVKRSPYFFRQSLDEALPKLANLKRAR